MPATTLNHGIDFLKKKFVIVGHGLAGSILAHYLIDQLQDVVVIDGGLKHSATKVSAGLINPFIGPKLNLPGEFSACMSENLSFFEKIRMKSNRCFLESIDLYRVFLSNEQKTRWDTKHEIYQMRTLSAYDSMQQGLVTEYGAGKTSAWKFNTLEFIKYSRDTLRSHGKYLVETFNADKWKDHQIVFCDGYRSASNKWFAHLPWRPAQGEVLRIESTHNLNASNGYWHLVENDQGIARIGSTWKHDDIESGPTSLGREQILDSIDFLPSLKKASILNHRSGVRCGTIDRQPILGSHPEIAKYHIFNGFGSRGCTTITLSAKQFTAYLIHGIALPLHKDIRRFL